MNHNIYHRRMLMPWIGLQFLIVIILTIMVTIYGTFSWLNLVLLVANLCFLIVNVVRYIDTYNDD